MPEIEKPLLKLGIVCANGAKLRIEDPSIPSLEVLRNKLVAARQKPDDPFILVFNGDMNGTGRSLINALEVSHAIVRDDEEARQLALQQRMMSGAPPPFLRG